MAEIWKRNTCSVDNQYGATKTSIIDFMNILTCIEINSDIFYCPDDDVDKI